MCGRLLVLVFLLFAQLGFGQSQMSLKAKMVDYINDNFLLLSGDEGGVYVVDSATVNTVGELKFSWNGKFGFYRIAGEMGSIDIRIMDNNFDFTLTGSIGNGELSFAENDENNQYQYYLSELNLLNKSIYKLHADLEKQNVKDTLYKDKYAEFKQLKKEKRSFLKDLWGSNIDSWSARFALAQQELVPDIKLKANKADEYYLKHFFDYFAFSDTLLVGTPVYYEKIGKYLKVIKLNELIKNGNYKKIKELLGNLFWLTELDPGSQKYLANYLFNRYPEEKYPQVYYIVAEAYRVLNTCEYVLNSRIIRNRIANAKNIKKGWQAPDVALYHSLDGRFQSLSDVNSELTLFIVWSGSCKHSVELLTKISQLYYLYKELGLEIVAVSLDNNLDFWRQTISYKDFSWINACDTDGLNGSVASQFSIHLTPSMFILDPSLKVVAVPQTFFQLEKVLNEVFQ
ncbi:thioredoxin-like domain-containing protein [Marinifilum sp. RC60d5]|uniref:thioredoxin-like domain-containing protein n=1 Tax=Marinifilum sp. RC60d5 TaxID=3458414 RepID=UPI004036F6DC